MRTEPRAARASEELLERYARLALERDELAARVAELEGALETTIDIPRRSRRRDALVLLGVVTASALTLGVVLAGTALIAGFWEPLENDQANPDVTASAPPPTRPESSPEPSRTASRPASSPTPEVPPTSASGRARTKLVVVAAGGDSWLQVRRKSATGSVVYEGTLRQGDSERFSARRLWFRFGVGDHLEVSVNGKPASDLPTLAGDALATRAGVRVLTVG